MQVYPVLLMLFIYRLPESPRWFVSKERKDDAHDALVDIYGKEDAKSKLDELTEAAEKESSQSTTYSDMLWPSGKAFHPTAVTIMGQVNQALTGYGAVSVYGPQIFELLGFGVRMSEYLTQGNYIQYFLFMTVAWLIIDRVGRRILMVGGAFGIAACFLILTLLGGLAQHDTDLGIPNLAVSIPGIVILYIATSFFGIGWLSEVWLIPTEIYPMAARAQGSAISVVIWGLANFAVTLLTPIGFNNLNYWLFAVFAATNLFAGWWTWVCLLRHMILPYLPLTTSDRHTLLKQAAVPLEKINNSSKTQRSITHGASAKLTKASSSTCLKVRKAVKVRTHHCLVVCGVMDHHDECMAICCGHTASAKLFM